jgi:hypothetical protein
MIDRRYGRLELERELDAESAPLFAGRVRGPCGCRGFNET